MTRDYTCECGTRVAFSLYDDRLCHKCRFRTLGDDEIRGIKAVTAFHLNRKRDRTAKGMGMGGGSGVGGNRHTRR